MVHAGRWDQSEAVDLYREKHSAKLELEVGFAVVKVTGLVQFAFCEL